MSLPRGKARAGWPGPVSSIPADQSLDPDTGLSPLVMPGLSVSSSRLNGL